MVIGLVLESAVIILYLILLAPAEPCKYNNNKSGLVYSHILACTPSCMNYK